MEKLIKAQLASDAKKLMAAHKKEKVFATQDGNYFFENNMAVLHNKDLKSADKEWDGDVIEFDADKPTEEAATIIEEAKPSEETTTPKKAAKKK